MGREVHGGLRAWVEGALQFAEGAPDYAFCIQYGYHMATHQETDKAGETLFLRPGQR